MDWLSRTELLLGEERLGLLKKAHVLVAGLGGVGAYAAEQLCRAGIGEMTIIDGDCVDVTNKNRQLPALDSNIGKAKAEIMATRFRDINPDIKLHVINDFIKDDRMVDILEMAKYDYVVDAVDTVTAKISLVMKAQEAGTPVISSMGAGNKLDPSRFQVADIYKTKVCPLAKVMRRELKKRGVRKLKVVYSDELPTRPINDMAISCRTNCICPPGAKHKCTERRDIPGSTAFVPSVAGLIIAGEVIRDLTKDVRVTAESVENQQ